MKRLNLNPAHKRRPVNFPQKFRHETERRPLRLSARKPRRAVSRKPECFNVIASDSNIHELWLATKANGNLCAVCGHFCLGLKRLTSSSVLMMSQFTAMEKKDVIDDSPQTHRSKVVDKVRSRLRRHY